MHRYVVLVLFLLLVVGGGSGIGLMTAPGPWFETLAKPSFQPPNWLFGPVWTTLYVLIAVAGWRTFERDSSGPAMKIWWAQLVLNFAWSPIFFSLHSPGAALVVILLMLVTIILFVVNRWSRDTVTAILFLPYLAWVSFATLLNAAIVWLN